MTLNRFKISLLVIITLSLLASGCGNSAYSGSDSDYVGGYYSGSSYDDYENAPVEPENPYSTFQEGHYAGYEWAQDNEVDSCGGNSDSFIEGCEEYVNERDEYQSSLDEQDYQDDYDYQYPY